LIVSDQGDQLLCSDTAHDKTTLIGSLISLLPRCVVAK